MRDPFVFDSRSEFCKKPFGAAPCGSEVMFHVRPLTRDGYSRCVLVARREFSGEEIQMELLPEAVDVPASPASSPPPQNRSCSGIISA